MERFHWTFCEKVLDSYVSENLEQVREISAAWSRSYNEERLHEALGSLPRGSTASGCSQRNTPLLNCLLDGEAYSSTKVPCARITPSLRYENRGELEC